MPPSQFISRLIAYHAPSPAMLSTLIGLFQKGKTLDEGPCCDTRRPRRRGGALLRSSVSLDAAAAAVCRENVWHGMRHGASVSVHVIYVVGRVKADPASCAWVAEIHNIHYGDYAIEVPGSKSPTLPTAEGDEASLNRLRRPGGSFDPGCLANTNAAPERSAQRNKRI